MSTFDIITDSTSDLSLELRSKFDIDYCKMEFSAEDKTYHASLDWDEISYKTFYDSMRQGKRYKTVQVPVKTFDDVFRKHLENGNDILYIACSSGLSGSYNAAKVYVEELKSDFPGRKIVCIDSLIKKFTHPPHCPTQRKVCYDNVKPFMCSNYFLIYGKQSTCNIYHNTMLIIISKKWFIDFDSVVDSLFHFVHCHDRFEIHTKIFC